MPNPCGPATSLEELISDRQLVHRACNQNLLTGKESRQMPGIDAIFTAARAGNPPARAQLDECGYDLGTALADLVDVLTQQLVLLGGFLHDGYDLFCDTDRRRPCVSMRLAA